MKALYALVVALGLTGLVQGAVTIGNISKSEFDGLISSSEVSWAVVFRGGADFGPSSEEIQVSRNGMPQSGGGSNTWTGQIVWSHPITDVTVTLNEASNIIARAASVEVIPNLGVTRLTNQILILNADSQIFGRSSTLSKAMVNGVNIRNLFADGNAFYNYDGVAVTNFGNTVDFSANWSPSDSPAEDLQYVMVVGLNNPNVSSIPEPSSLLFGFLSLLFLTRRRR